MVGTSYEADDLAKQGLWMRRDFIVTHLTPGHDGNRQLETLRKKGHASIFMWMVQADKRDIRAISVWDDPGRIEKWNALITRLDVPREKTGVRTIFVVEPIEELPVIEEILENEANKPLQNTSQ
ncbi:hypothetical protein ACFLS1_09235 [Verrucomicrobiota bacterium]